MQESRSLNRLRILDIMQHNDKMFSLEEIANELNMSISGARKNLQPLMKDGYIEKISKGRGGVFYKAVHTTEDNYIFIKLGGN